MIATEKERIHLFTMLMGERFRAGGEVFELAHGSMVHEGESEPRPVAIRPDGRPVTLSSIPPLNGGSYFVEVVP